MLMPYFECLHHILMKVPVFCLLQVRLVLDRDEDMAITGQRHPFMAKYKVSNPWSALSHHCLNSNQPCVSDEPCTWCVTPMCVPAAPSHRRTERLSLAVTHTHPHCAALRCAELPSLPPLQVGFTQEGKLLALDLNLYNNAGNSLDLSHSIMDRALLHFDVVYKIPHARAQVRRGAP